MGKLVSKTVFIFAATFFFASNVSCGPDDNVSFFEAWRTHLSVEIIELEAVSSDAKDYERIRERKRVFAVLNGDLDAVPGLATVVFRIVNAVETVNLEEQNAQRARALRTKGS